MIFEISRTSEYYVPSNNPPCDGCIETSVELTWKRELKKVYVKEINTLEELMHFVENEGEGKIVILPKGRYNDCGYPEIEIYDDYRE